MQTLETTPLVAQPPLVDRGELTVADTGLTDAPSAWQAAGGAVTQAAAIDGTTALLAPSVGDLTLALTLSSSADGAIGAVLRYSDAANLVRFAMDRTAGRRSLISLVDGMEALLWQDDVAIDLDHDYALTLGAQGGRLQGWLDGAALFDVVAPAGARAGQVGLWTSRTGGARFTRLVVGNPVARVGAWTIDDDAAASLWRSGGGALVQQAAVGDASTPAAPGTTAVAGSDGWADVRVSATLRNDGAGAIGLAVRWRDPSNLYRLAFDAQHGYRRLVRIASGLPTVLWQDAGPVPPGTPLAVTIDAVGERLVGRLGEEVLFDLTDDSLATGRVGLYAAGGDGARFAHVTVTRPPLDARARFRDGFGHGDMSAWTIVDEGDQSTPSQWAVDAGALVQSSNIFSNPLDGAAIEKRGTLALAGDPSWTDTVLSLTLTSTDDDAIGVLLRYAGPGDFYRFSMDRERGYRRLVRCSGGTFTTLWEDAVAYDINRPYALVLAAVGTRLTGWLDGVPLLEVEDPSGPLAGLVKSVGGVVTELWSDAAAFPVGRDYLLTLDAVGDGLTGFLNGEPLFAVRDPDILAGAAGCYCWHADAARFASFRALVADWTPHVRFAADEPVLAAGTRIVVYSGNAADWAAAPVPGVADRFLATLGDPGQRHLSPTTSVALRVRDALGALGHARVFLPDSAYTPLPGATVLRRADGLDVAIFPATSPGIDPGELRLRLVYRRDNTAADPASAVLSQAGDRADEQVTLRVPVPPL